MRDITWYDVGSSNQPAAESRCWERDMKDIMYSEVDKDNLMNVLGTVKVWK